MEEETKKNVTRGAAVAALLAGGALTAHHIGGRTGRAMGRAEGVIVAKNVKHQARKQGLIRGFKIGKEVATDENIAELKRWNKSIQDTRSSRYPKEHKIQRNIERGRVTLREALASKAPDDIYSSAPARMHRIYQNILKGRITGGEAIKGHQ